MNAGLTYILGDWVTYIYVHTKCEKTSTTTTDFTWDLLIVNPTQGKKKGKNKQLVLQQSARSLSLTPFRRQSEFLLLPSFK